jgi:hypothetical protein
VKLKQGKTYRKKGEYARGAFWFQEAGQVRAQCGADPLATVWWCEVMLSAHPISSAARSSHLRARLMFPQLPHPILCNHCVAQHKFSVITKQFLLHLKLE